MILKAKMETKVTKLLLATNIALKVGSMILAEALLPDEWTTCGASNVVVQ